MAAVFLATTVNVLDPKSVDRDRLIETRVQSGSASGTAHTQMKNLKTDQLHSVREHSALLNGGLRIWPKSKDTVQV